MHMNNGEFYSANEYNSTAEYKSFPAEIYYKSQEINPSGKEQPRLGDEITTIEKKRTRRKKAEGSGGLLEKIMNSVKSVATTVTVAAAAIVVTTTLVTEAPKIDLVSFDIGDNFAQYSFSIEEMQDDKQYAVVVSTSNDEPQEQEIIKNELGEYNGIFENLKPSWEYKLSVIGKDRELGNITYFEKRFQTTSPKDNEIPSKDDLVYNGSYKPPSIEDIKIKWNADEEHNALQLKAEFESLDEVFRYEIVGTDENGQECLIFASNKDDEGEALISKNVFLCSLTFNIYAENTLVKSESIGTVDLRPAEIKISDYEACGIGTIKLYLDVINPQNSTIISPVLNITSENGEELTVDIEDNDFISGFVIVEMESSQKFSVIESHKEENTKFLNQREAISNYELSFDNTLTTDFWINVESATAAFVPKSMAENARYIKIVNSLGEETLEELYVGRFKYYINHQPDADSVYTVILLDENESPVSSEIQINAPKAPEYGDFVFNYKNPNQTGMTYNSDGSVNLYIKTDFSSEDSELYYQISLQYLDVEYKSRDQIARILNIPYTPTPIEYRVCKDYMGVQYVYREIIPSGMLAENELETTNRVSGNISENNVSLVFDELESIFDYSNIRVVNNTTGEEIILTKEDLTFNESEYSSTAEVVFKEAAESVTIYVRGNPHFAFLDSIDDLVGDKFLMKTVTITK